MKLTDLVKEKVYFEYFQGNKLYYRTESGFLFPIPIDDTVNTQGESPIFKNEDKGIYFMRWIRQALNA